MPAEPQPVRIPTPREPSITPSSPPSIRSAPRRAPLPARRKVTTVCPTTSTHVSSPSCSQIASEAHAVWLPPLHRQDDAGMTEVQGRLASVVVVVGGVDVDVVGGGSVALVEVVDTMVDTVVLVVVVGCRSRRRSATRR